MRLLNATTHEFQDFYDGNPPPYGILSHTWGYEEVSYHDLRHGLTETVQYKYGWRKIDHCCRQAQKDSLEFVWVDTCCIDKSSSAELQEAINSMFHWYEMSTECYVFLGDFERPSGYSTSTGDDSQVQSADAAPSRLPGTAETSLPGFKNARWFRRGWTLQELLAPESVRFFDSQWREFGDKVSLRVQLAEITRISEEILLATVMGARQAMSGVSVAQRMSWASSRVTTRIEDTAYCLLGIFDVNMPLIYGEGPKAFQRLQEEIMKISADQSLLAWGFGCKNSSLWGVSTALALSPADFAGCNNVVAWGPSRPGDSFFMTQRGLSLNLPVAMSLDGGNLVYFVLNCTTKDKIPPDGDARAARVMAIPCLRPRTWAENINPHPDEFYPLSARMPLWIDRGTLSTAGTLRAFLPRFFRHGPTTYQRLRVSLNLENMPENWYIGGVFPPESSDNDCLVMHPWSRRLQAADKQSPNCCFIVHFASSSPELGGFVAVLDFDGVDVVELFKSPANTLPSFSDLKSSVFRTISEIMEVNLEDISSETQLESLGMESLMSIEIASCLGEMLHVDINTSYFFQSKTIGDLLAKLRFVTRPTYGLLRNTVAEDKGRRSSSIPRLRVTSARFCVREVGRSFSFKEIAEDVVVGFRDQLTFTEAGTTKIEIQTPVDEIRLSLDIADDPVSLVINAGGQIT